MRERKVSAPLKRQVRLSQEANKKQVSELYTHLNKNREKNLWVLVEAYLPLLKSLVSRMQVFFPNSVEKDDIYSIALLGLIDAAKNFDSSYKNGFANYARIKIKGALLDELRRLDFLSRAQRKRVKNYQKVVLELEGKLKRKPLEKEIQQALNISDEEFVLLSNLKAPVLIPLDAPCSYSEQEVPKSLAEIVSDTNAPNSRDLAEEKDLVEILKQLIVQLEPILQKILAMYYIDGLKLAEIAQVFNLTESRISQLHAKALQSLRYDLKQKFIPQKIS